MRQAMPDPEKAPAPAIPYHGPVFLTPRQLTERPLGISMRTLRGLLFERQENGLARCVVKLGPKALLIDEAKFIAWLEERREG